MKETNRKSNNLTVWQQELVLNVPFPTPLIPSTLLYYWTSIFFLYFTRGSVMWHFLIKLYKIIPMRVFFRNYFFSLFSLILRIKYYCLTMPICPLWCRRHTEDRGSGCTPLLGTSAHRWLPNCLFFSRKCFWFNVNQKTRIREGIWEKGSAWRLAKSFQWQVKILWIHEYFWGSNAELRRTWIKQLFVK